MPILRAALDGDLSLRDLGTGWVFLHQEWRWRTEGGKSDILAVHLPTSRLGIVEFKSDENEMPTARTQVDEYGAYWARHAQELAPFFTELLRALGAAYGNDMMANATVSPDPAHLFVGVASPRDRVHVWAR